MVCFLKHLPPFGLNLFCTVQSNSFHYSSVRLSDCTDKLTASFLKRICIIWSSTLGHYSVVGLAPIKCCPQGKGMALQNGVITFLVQGSFYPDHHTRPSCFLLHLHILHLTNLCDPNTSTLKLPVHNTLPNPPSIKDETCFVGTI